MESSSGEVSKDSGRSPQTNDQHGSPVHATRSHRSRRPHRTLSHICQAVVRFKKRAHFEDDLILVPVQRELEPPNDEGLPDVVLTSHSKHTVVPVPLRPRLEPPEDEGLPEVVPASRSKHAVIPMPLQPRLRSVKDEGLPEVVPSSHPQHTSFAGKPGINQEHGRSGSWLDLQSEEGSEEDITEKQVDLSTILEEISSLNTWLGPVSGLQDIMKEKLDLCVYRITKIEENLKQVNAVLERLRQNVDTLVEQQAQQTHAATQKNSSQG